VASIRTARRGIRKHGQSRQGKEWGRTRFFHAAKNLHEKGSPKFQGEWGNAQVKFAHEAKGPTPKVGRVLTEFLSTVELKGG